LGDQGAHGDSASDGSDQRIEYLAIVEPKDEDVQQSPRVRDRGDDRESSGIRLNDQLHTGPAVHV
jgi:hypothetical protein